MANEEWQLLSQNELLLFYYKPQVETRWHGFRGEVWGLVPVPATAIFKFGAFFAKGLKL